LRRRRRRRRWDALGCVDGCVGFWGCGVVALELSILHYS